MMNVLSGTYPAGSYSGEIYYDGKLCQFKNQKDSEAVGIVIIHQELALIPLLSIGENMDAITGATVTSRAVANAVNSASAFVTGADVSSGATEWGG